MTITARFGFVQTLVILSLFYGALIGPVSIGMAIARKDLLNKRNLRVEGTAWEDADSAEPDLERAKLLS
jgi:hypothetical protein